MLAILALYIIGVIYASLKISNVKNSAKNQLQCFKSSIENAFIKSCENLIVCIEMKLDLNAIDEQYCCEFVEILKEDSQTGSNKDSQIIIVDYGYQENMKTMNIDIKMYQKSGLLGFFDVLNSQEETLLLFKESARGKLSSFPKKNDSIDINIFKAPFHFVYDKCSGIDPLERYTDAALVQISY